MQTHRWRIRMRYINQGISSGLWFCGLANQAHKSHGQTCKNLCSNVQAPPPTPIHVDAQAWPLGRQEFGFNVMSRWRSCFGQILQPACWITVDL